jgi:hypothetical protein
LIILLSRTAKTASNGEFGLGEQEEREQGNCSDEDKQHGGK